MVGVGATDTVVCADTLPPDPVAVTVNRYEAAAGPPFAGRVAVIVAPPVVLVVLVGRPGMPGLADNVKLVASVEATVNESGHRRLGQRGRRSGKGLDHRRRDGARPPPDSDGQTPLPCVPASVGSGIPLITLGRCWAGTTRLVGVAGQRGLVAGLDDLAALLVTSCPRWPRRRRWLTQTTPGTKR